MDSKVCFPYCATFEQDQYTQHWYCVECHADEKNVSAHWEEINKQELKDFYAQM